MSELEGMVSIIMPVHNAEKYVEAAIRSVLSQRYSIWELIIVDDASTDCSLNLCMKLAKLDQRICLIHKEKNEGPGAARNTGMVCAKGEWLLFMDSDDRLDTELLSGLMVNAKKRDCDIIVFGFTQEYEDKNGVIKKKVIRSCQSVNAKNHAEVGDLAIRLDYDSVFAYVWNKLYRMKSLRENGVEFETIKMMEDTLFNLRAFLIAERVICVTQNYYHYRKPSHVTLASEYIEDFHLLSLRRYIEEKELLLSKKANTKENEELLNRIYIKHIFSAIVRVASNQKICKKQKLDKISEILDHEEVHLNLQRCQVCGVKYKSLSIMLSRKKYKLCFYIAVLYNQGRRIYGKAY